MRSSSVYLDEEDFAYMDRLSKSLKVSRNEVMRRALAALRVSRQDYATPLNGLRLVAQAIRAGAMGRDEAAMQIDRLLVQMKVLRPGSNPSSAWTGACSASPYTAHRHTSRS
jgi:hypothetical protein